MHSGKMYEAGKADAYKECYRLLQSIMTEKEGFIKKTNTDGLTIEYCPDYILRALGLTLMQYFDVEEKDNAKKEKI